MFEKQFLPSGFVTRTDKEMTSDGRHMLLQGEVIRTEIKDLFKHVTELRTSVRVSAYSLWGQFYHVVSLGEELYRLLALLALVAMTPLVLGLLLVLHRWAEFPEELLWVKESMELGAVLIATGLLSVFSYLMYNSYFVYTCLNTSEAREMFSFSGLEDIPLPSNSTDPSTSVKSEKYPQTQLSSKHWK